MTPQWKKDVEQLDSWLAAQDIAGVQFEWAGRPGCTDFDSSTPEIGCFIFRLMKQESALLSRIGAASNGSLTTHLILTNNVTHGNVAAIRARLHELEPWLTETPERSSPAPTHAQGNT